MHVRLLTVAAPAFVGLAIACSAFAQAPPPVASQAAASTAETELTTPVAGNVRTTTSLAVPGATVRAVNTDTQKVWISWADESGKFEFPSLPEGHYKVEASQLGFVSASTEVRLGAGPSPPALQIVLRVATLAELNGASETPAATKPAGARPAGQPAPSSRGGMPNAGGGNRGGPGGGFGGRGQLPVGIVNAVRSGMASGGFQQTELTGDGSSAAQVDQSAEPGGASVAAAPPQAGGAGATSDAFLLQGTVGQGLAFNGPGGPGGFGPPGEFAVGGLGMPGAPGGGGPVAVAGGGPGSPGGGPPGGTPPGGGPGMFGGGPGGRGAAGRLFRQQVNRVRFSLYDRFADSAWNAKPYSITGAQYPQIPSYNERIGLNVGGPLKIPHVYNGSDRTYFFVNYQHDWSKNPVNTFSTVPTADQRNGLFCGTTIFEPFTTTPFPSAGNGCQQIPTSDFANNTAVQGLLAFIPPPNLPGNVQNYVLQEGTPAHTDILNTRVLHTINSKFNLNGGYNLNSQRATTVSNFVDIGGHQSTLGQNADLGLVHNWSSLLIEDTHFNWSRNRIELLSNNSYTNNVATALGITGVSTAPADYGIPQISFTEFGGLNDPVPSLVRNQTWRFSDNVTWTHKAHTVRFGGEIRRIELNTLSNPDPRGGFIFTGVATGNDFADFLEDRPYNTAVQFGNPNLYLRSWGFAAFAQDDFRVTTRFTLQYGLRYDAVTPPVELNNGIVNLDVNPQIAEQGPSCTTCVARVQPGDAGPFSGQFPRALVHGNYTNFAPRLGIAWQPPIKPKTIVRAGYSIFYNESIYNSLGRQLAYQPPISTAQTLTTTSTAPLTLENGFQGEAVGTIEIPNTASVDPFYRNGYAQVWNLSTETSLSPNWILDLTYTGTKGTYLDILRAPNRAPLGTPSTDIQANRIDPLATGFTFDQSGANSIYNALQARVMHRFTHGFMLQGIYTYGKSLDDSSSIGGNNATV